MNQIDVLLRLVQTHDALIILILSALVLCLLIFNLYLSIKLGRLSKSGSRVAAASDLPVDYTELAQRIVGLEGEITQIRARQEVFTKQLASSMQNIGLVRFDAFPDIGGEQSFSLALLDQDKSGVVISNLYGRTDSRVYAKEVKEGRSNHTLSDEEIDAISRAKSPAG